MSDTGKRKPIPPYVSFKTFINFIDGLKVALPQRVDKSLMKSLSGGVQSHLMASLEYLGLITSEHLTTDALNRLVHSEGAGRQQALKEIITQSYKFIFENGMDLDRATIKQLSECFEKTGASGNTSRKCVSFFVHAAKEAGIRLSPHILNVSRSRSKTRRKTVPTQPMQGDTDQPSASTTTVKDAIPAAQEDLSLEKILLSKFPAFDPNWDSEVQVRWFDGFEKLMARMQKKSGD